MVLGAITILMALIANFTFETEVNKLKVYNGQDLITARNMAESGLEISLARLLLFQEALNILENDPQKKKIIRPQMLDMVWSVPFLYPIPTSKEANIVQRNAIEEFQKNSLLQGEMQVTVQNVSNLININLLRPTKKKVEAEPTPTPDPNKPDLDSDPDAVSDPDPESTANDQITTIQQTLTELLEKRLEEKKESDEDFDEKYGSTTASMLIKELKFFVNDPDSYSDADNTEIEALYSNNNITPKHAPLSSLSELYLLQGWKDSHIDLIKNDITVHGNKTIDVNKITQNGLKMFLPDLNEDQVKQFFKYRDDPARPHNFNSFQDFTDYIVNQAKFMEQNSFDKRVEIFKKAGIDFDVTGSLFKVISQGKYQKANYTLTAFVTIPAIISPIPKKPVDPEGKCPEGFDFPKHTKKYCIKVFKDAQGNPTRPPITYQGPRVVELLVN